MTEKVEIGKWYKNKDTGKVCRVTQKLLFDTCIVYMEEDAEIEYNNSYSAFCENWIDEEESIKCPNGRVSQMGNNQDKTGSLIYPLG